MNFYSETYHESVKYAAKAVADPIVLQWEKHKAGDRRYAGCNRLDVHCDEVPGFGYVSGDGLKPVGVYVVLRGRKLPDGIYAYDAEGKSGAPGLAGQLVKIGGREEMKTLAAAFPDKDFVCETPVLYIFTGILERAVWRFKESAYSQVQRDVGACVGSVLLDAKRKGGKAFPLGGFVDDDVANVLKLGATEVPLACLAVFPEYSEVAFDSVDDGVGESAYSNRSEMEMMADASRYPSRFMHQNRAETIEDLSKCIRVRRLVSQALPGDEFPLTPAKYGSDSYLSALPDLGPVNLKCVPFRKFNMDLDDFSSMLRWLELGPINLFGAGLLKIWIVTFDVMFVYPGVYRYVPVRKSIYMQSGQVMMKKLMKCHAAPESVENAAFAVVLTADLKEACNLLGERAYRYLNLNAGYILQSLNLSGRILNKTVRDQHFFYEDDLKKLCNLPDGESVISEILVGKA